MEFQAIVVIGFRFANITNKPNKSNVIRNLMATCSFYCEIVLPVCLKIRRDTAKCMFSSFPVFRITNGTFRGIFRFDVSRYPAAGKCFQKTRYPAVRNFDQKQCLKSLECSKQLPGVFTQSK